MAQQRFAVTANLASACIGNDPVKRNADVGH